MCVLSRVRLFVTPWTIAHQAPLSMGFSRQENWKGCHTLLLGFFLTQGLNTSLLCLLHWQGGFFTTSAIWEAPYHIISSVQSLSPIPTLYNPMDCSTPGFPVHDQLLELAQTHVRRVGDAIQPCPLSVVPFIREPVIRAFQTSHCGPGERPLWHIWQNRRLWQRST